MSNSLDPDQARRIVGPDLGPNCLPSLSEDDTGRQRVKYLLKSGKTGFLVTDVKSYDMSLVRKPAFCICENKDADQLRGNSEADQRLCFRYTDSTIPLLSKSEISSF